MTKLVLLISILFFDVAAGHLKYYHFTFGYGGTEYYFFSPATSATSSQSTAVSYCTGVYPGYAHLASRGTGRKSSILNQLGIDKFWVSGGSSYGSKIALCEFDLKVDVAPVTIGDKGYSVSKWASSSGNCDHGLASLPSSTLKEGATLFNYMTKGSSSYWYQGSSSGYKKSICSQPKFGRNEQNYGFTTIYHKVDSSSKLELGPYYVKYRSNGYCSSGEDQVDGDGPLSSYATNHVGSGKLCQKKKSDNWITMGFNDYRSRMQILPLMNNGRKSYNDADNSCRNQGGSILKKNHGLAIIRDLDKIINDVIVKAWGGSSQFWYYGENVGGSNKYVICERSVQSYTEIPRGIPGMGGDNRDDGFSSMPHYFG